MVVDNDALNTALKLARRLGELYTQEKQRSDALEEENRTLRRRLEFSCDETAVASALLGRKD